MMKNTLNILILLTFFVFMATAGQAIAEPKQSIWGWSKKQQHYAAYKKYNPYLEDVRHLQIPQWAHEEWYAEDWLSQKDGLELIQGFYKANILKDQKVAVKSQLPVLVVGPNFYRLSGYDKRRVAHTVDVVYGITEAKPNGAYMLEDWHTKRAIGVFDDNGLRLH